MMIFLAIAILGLLIISIGVYLSENIIWGIYNEEIQYVKTNKSRYDWNWLNKFLNKYTFKIFF